MRWRGFFVYDGTEKKPTIVVKDGEAVIPASEYTVTYSDNTDVGTAKRVIVARAAVRGKGGGVLSAVPHVGNRVPGQLPGAGHSTRAQLCGQSVNAPKRTPTAFLRASPP